MLAARAAAPFDARHSTVSIRVVRGLAAAAERRGVPRSELLRWAQLSPAQLACPDARISHAELHRLCELAMDTIGDPALGLHWGEKLNGCAFNPIADLIAHAPTLRAGLEALGRFHPLLSDRASFQLSEHDDRVTLRCTPLHGASQRMQRFASEACALGLFRVIRGFNSQGLLQRASFEYEAPGYRPEYSRVFRGAECFEQPFTGIEFDRALMDAASPHRDVGMHDALHALAERQMSRTPRAPIALRLREILVQQQHLGLSTDMSSVSRLLGLSVRSLRRRLTAEGKSYAAVVNDALVTVALHLLVDQGRSIQETAYEMGFSEASAFHRAFKSWTGTTPREFRNTHSSWVDRPAAHGR